MRSKPDPVFAKIEKHRDALHGLRKAWAACTRFVKPPPHLAAREERAMGVEIEAAAALARTVPTSAMGLRTFVGYITDLGDDWGDGEQNFAALKSIRAALSSIPEIRAADRAEDQKMAAEVSPRAGACT